MTAPSRSVVAVNLFSMLPGVDPADFEALGRLMNAVSDQLIAGHPDREMR